MGSYTGMALLCLVNGLHVEHAFKVGRCGQLGLVPHGNAVTPSVQRWGAISITWLNIYLLEFHVASI